MPKKPVEPADLEQEIRRKQREMRAARAAASDARRRAKPAMPARANGASGVASTEDRAARLRNIDDEIRRKQQGLRAARRAAPGVRREPRSTDPLAAGDARPLAGRTSGPIEARRVGPPSALPTRTLAQRRRIAVVAVVGTAAIGGGLVAGALTDNGGAAGSTPDRAQPAIAAYGKALNREIETLGAARTTELARLRTSETRVGQASTAADLAAAHRRAARSLADAAPPAGLEARNDSLADALIRVAAAYGRLSAGAADRDPKAYEAAQAAVRVGEASLQERLRALRA